MSETYLLLSPSANRVYAATAPKLAAAELAITARQLTEVTPTTLAGVSYLVAKHNQALTSVTLEALARSGSFLAAFSKAGPALTPVEIPHTDWCDDDLVTIPRYAGKTNEQFTRLLMNLTLAARTNPKPGPLRVLDPLAGRGTTLTTAWTLGHHAYGVEADAKAVAAFAGFLTGYLRRKRLKHQAGTSPVRRNGKSLGKRFDATIRSTPVPLDLTVFTADARESAERFGKQRFDAIVTDAPYGVEHGARTDGSRKRSPADLMVEAVPIWVSQLAPGGAIGISWNTHTMKREALTELLLDAGLVLPEDPAWGSFEHRVDASIMRDLIVGVKQ